MAHHIQEATSTWKTPHVRFNLRSTPRLDEEGYKRAALKMKSGNNVSSITSDRNGIWIVLRVARNMYAANQTYRGQMQTSYPKYSWTLTAHGSLEREPPECVDASVDRPATTEDVASGTAKVKASATPHTSEEAEGSVMMNICNGNVGLDSYDGLQASLSTPWERKLCLGCGSYGSVRAFPMSRKRRAQPDTDDEHVAV